jgi:ankyrin repeat protein
MPRSREDWFEAEQLIRAAQDGDLLAVQQLAASGFDVNLMDELSKAALHYSVEGEHYKVAQWLIENGADVNLHDDEMIGETALSLAAQGDYPEIVELLLKHGADPDITGWMKQTARTRAHKRKDAEGKKIAGLIEQYKPTKLNPGDRQRR